MDRETAERLIDSYVGGWRDGDSESRWERFRSSAGFAGYPEQRFAGVAKVVVDPPVAAVGLDQFGCLEPREVGRDRGGAQAELRWLSGTFRENPNRFSPYGTVVKLLVQAEDKDYARDGKRSRSH